jgi:adenylate cyclase
MKFQLKVWHFQIPVILLTGWAYLTFERGRNADLHQPTELSTFESLRSLQGTFTNFKFKVRGPQPPDPKIVVVAIDSPSLEMKGRWPWHRDETAHLIDRVFALGAKQVGLDIVFSEADKRISDNMRALLETKGLGQFADGYETDRELSTAISQNPERIVLGWTTENFCSRPNTASEAECPAEALAGKDWWLPTLNLETFAFETVTGPVAYTPKGSPMTALMRIIANIPEFAVPAKHAGFFSVAPDADSYIRRHPLVMMANGKAMPSLPLTMAKLALNEKLDLEFDSELKVAAVRFKNSGRVIPAGKLGSMEVNFRGPAYTYPYVTAGDILAELDAPDPEQLVYGVTRGEKIETIGRPAIKELLKDAYVFIGVTALGLHDMRAFPFDANTPGVEGHATIFDNLLHDDMLTEASGAGKVILTLLLTLFALAFAYATHKLESIPGVILFTVLLLGFGLFDFQWLFARRNVNWNTSLFYLEYGFIFLSTFAAKYVLEERNKKFIRMAFSKYVAPTVVDSILKDPAKLSVGGTRRELSILFSDIRGFTTFSEKMDAVALSKFLNEYLGVMTDLVFKHGGTLDKYIGDAVMAFWGAPLDQPEHAANALKTAIEMQKGLQELRPVLKQKYDVEVAIGIGINSGNVSVGNMGSDRIFEYTVIGDHVNLASRLEGVTKTYGVEILTTRFTLAAIEAAGLTPPAHRVLDHLKVKGKTQAVELIEVFVDPPAAPLLDAFQKGRTLYRNRHWDDALAEFAKADALAREAGRPGDAPSQVFMERCKEFKESAPAADWDGSWEMHSK